MRCPRLMMVVRHTSIAGTGERKCPSRASFTSSAWRASPTTGLKAVSVIASTGWPSARG